MKNGIKMEKLLCSQIVHVITSNHLLELENINFEFFTPKMYFIYLCILRTFSPKSRFQI